MLNGPDLGSAIARAVNLKGVSKKAFADAMGVKPASVQDWIKFGRVAKTRINDLVAYFSDVVPVEYWGLDFGADENRTQNTTHKSVNNTYNESKLVQEISQAARLAESEGVAPDQLLEILKILQKLRAAQRAALAVHQSFADLERSAESPSRANVEQGKASLTSRRRGDDAKNERTGTTHK